MKNWFLKRFLAVALMACLAACSLTGCDDEEGYDDDYEYYDEEETKSSSSGSYQRESELNTGDATSVFSESQVRKPQVQLKGDGNDKVTIMVYMNGSNLESDNGSATEDFSEMIAAGSSDNVNLIVQTMGTKKWNKKYGIASDRAQTYRVNGNGLELVRDNLGQLDCTDGKTLQEFIAWTAQAYPADRYILEFWDHGAGAVYGFGMDENNSDENATLTVDEIQAALKKAGVYFDFIGMDCCIMSSLEVCCAMYDYCDYMILSEDFEPGIGWDYTGWLKALNKNSSISTLELGKVIVDDMVNTNVRADSTENAILALIDESMMKVLYMAWTDFAYANANTLTGKNYSRKMTRSAGGREHPILRNKGFFSDWLSDEEEVTMSDYYITDIMAVANNIQSTESDALSAALKYAIRYANSSESDSGLTGLSVTLPYGDSDFYESLSTVFTNCGINADYVTWLGDFTSASGYDNFYEYDSWDDSWTGWDTYEADYNWDDWEYTEEEDAWDDSNYGWDEWNFEDSWNYWFGEQDFEDDDAYWDAIDDDDDDWFYDDDEFSFW